MSKQTGMNTKLLRILLSGGFVLASAAYAVWQHAVAVAQPRPAAQPVIAAAPKPQLPQQPQQMAALQAPPQPAPESERPAPTETPAPAEMPAPPAAAAPPQTQDAYVPPAPGTPPSQPIINFAPPDPPKPVRTVEAHAPYEDGEFTGNIAETGWGTVQVKVVVRGGVVAQVVPLDYPNHRRRSIEINEWAIPTLEQEAVTVQTGNIDLVSQATVTSEGYQESLASALAQAKTP